MRYPGFGTVGYGLQVAVDLALAGVSAVYLSSTFYFRGFDLPGLVTPIPGLVISLAWIYAGRERKSGLFVATGIIGVLIFATGIASVVVYSGSAPAIAGQSGTPSPQSLSSVLALLAIGAVVAILAVSFFVLETISFFVAGRIFQERMFRFAGWSRIFVLIGGAVILGVALFLGIESIFTSTPGAAPTLVSLQISTTASNQFANYILLATAGIYLLFAVPEVFAFLAFRRIRMGPSETPLQPVGPIRQPPSSTPGNLPDTQGPSESPA